MNVRAALGMLVFAIGVALALSGIAEARQVTVRRGDTLARIAKRHRVNIEDLRLANRIRGNRLRIGQTLTLPNRATIYVRRGENLTRVAKRVHATRDAVRRSNKLRRNATLRVGQRLIMPGFEPQPRVDYGAPEDAGVVEFSRLNERIKVRLVDSERRVLVEGLSELTRLLQPRQTDRAEVARDAGREEDEDDEDVAGSDQIDQEDVLEVAAPRRLQANPRLAFLLAKISDHFGGKLVRIVSGFREVRGYTRETSRHVIGNASDIHIRGVSNRAIWEFCRRLDHAGCGYYPRSTFVHVDARQRRTQWVDWSRPGRRARYGTLRGPTSLRRRRRMTRPRLAGDVPFRVPVVDADGNPVEVEIAQPMPRPAPPATRPAFELTAPNLRWLSLKGD